jgi:hypothetical protein
MRLILLLPHTVTELQLHQPLSRRDGRCAPRANPRCRLAALPDLPDSFKEEVFLCPVQQSMVL